MNELALYLTYCLGIDKEVSNFFVNRVVPKKNHYWRGKKVYLTSTLGYLFIPIYVDLLIKSGISKRDIYSDGFFSLFERILDSAAQLEFELINSTEHLDTCKKLASKYSTNRITLDEFERILEIKRHPILNLLSLQRANTFLYSLVSTNTNAEEIKLAVDVWNICVPLFLLFDDINDFSEDKLANDENAIIECGEGIQAIIVLTDFANFCIEKLSGINILLGKELSQLADKALRRNLFKILVS